MAMKPGLKDFLWLVAGAAITLAIMLTVLYLHEEQNPAAQLALKAKRVGLVEQMRLALASASEVEKSAVMATTDQDSQSFADQARGQVAAVERGRKELEGLLQTGGTKTEQDLLAQFTEAFAEFQRIDKDLLDLAIQNTNLKAYSLAFGPAAEALNEMDAALTRVIAQSVSSTAPDARQGGLDPRGHVLGREIAERAQGDHGLIERNAYLRGDRDLPFRSETHYLKRARIDYDRSWRGFERGECLSDGIAGARRG